MCKQSVVDVGEFETIYTCSTSSNEGMAAEAAVES